MMFVCFADSDLCRSRNGTFLCKNLQCILEHQKCDGRNDCDDHSDEMDCKGNFKKSKVFEFPLFSFSLVVLHGTLYVHFFQYFSIADYL